MSLWNLFLCGALCPSAEALGPGVGKDFFTQVSACQGSGPFPKFQRLHHPHGLPLAQPRLVQAALFSSVPITLLEGCFQQGQQLVTR